MRKSGILSRRRNDIIDRPFTPVTEEDLGLTPEELKVLVVGAQKYLPPQTEEGQPIPTDVGTAGQKTPRHPAENSHFLGVQEIVLTQGFKTLVDDEDFDSASALNWHARRKGKTVYALRKIRRPDGSRSVQYLHQFLFPEAGEIDHKDGDGLNNRRHNLLPCTHQQNLQSHRRKIPGTSSQFRSVTWHSLARKWAAQIKCNGKRFHLGLFLNESDAARAYDVRAREYFGIFAAPNFP